MQNIFGTLGFFGSSIGGGELVIILVVALLLFGAERLPAIARALGRALNELKRTANEIKEDFIAENKTISSTKEHDVEAKDVNPKDIGKEEKKIEYSG